MKAISIKQPWAKFIAQGFKTIEVRTWQTLYRGPLLIVSSLKPDDFMKTFPKKTDPTHGVWLKEIEGQNQIDGFYHLGQALAIVELWKIEPMKKEHEAAALCDSGPGLFSWHVRLIKRIEPFHVKGKLSIYEVETNF